MVIIAGMLGPLIGSLFISKISFNFSFIIVTVFLFASVLPLFYTKDMKIKKEKISLKTIIRAGSIRRGIIYQADGVLQLVGAVFWPIFIYLTLGSIVSLGVIISLTSLFLIIFMVYIGDLADRKKEKTLRAGIFLHAPTWIARLFFLTPFGLLIMNFLGSLTAAMITVPFNKIIYEKARKTKNIANYFIFREFHLGIGRAIILIIATITQSITWMFYTAFFVVFIHLLTKKE